MFSSWFSNAATVEQQQAVDAMEELPKVRILVLGDSGVGKTCLVERLVTGNVPSTPRWTLGCNVQVMLHTMVDKSNSTERKLIIEFWDIGGHRNFSDSRAVFFHQINGVFLVHDYANKKSFNNLKTWLEELEREDTAKRQRDMVGVEEPRFGRRAAASASSPRYKIANPPLLPQQQKLHFRGNSAATTAGPLDGLPILVVGNKCDNSAASAHHRVAPKMFNFDSVLTSAIAAHERILEQEKFAAFFQRVYDRRHG